MSKLGKFLMNPEEASMTLVEACRKMVNYWCGWRSKDPVYQEFFAALEAEEKRGAAVSKVADPLAQVGQNAPLVVRVSTESAGSLLPPIRHTERRDPLSADASGEWSDWD
jgi:hypothetical protein